MADKSWIQKADNPKTEGSFTALADKHGYKGRTLAFANHVLAANKKAEKKGTKKPFSTGVVRKAVFARNVIRIGK